MKSVRTRPSRSNHGLPPSPRRSTALIYCEGNLGRVDGKTANGLLRHSERYQILGVVDSHHAGRDAGDVLGGPSKGVPVSATVAEAVATAGEAPDFIIYGMAPASGMLSTAERSVLLNAMMLGMGVVNGLHQFLNDDADFAAAKAKYGVQVLDVRRPKLKSALRLFTGQIRAVSCPRIAILGTDGAIGKRTTATILTRALNEAGIHAVLINTGQTGLIQGARYGVALDAIPSQFCSGELEGIVVKAFETEQPDILIIEGQGALSHPAYLTSTFILRGAQPDAVILQHAPSRPFLCDFPEIEMPHPAAEIRLIEAFANTKVIGLTLNHEGMTETMVAKSIAEYESELNLPVTDALTLPTDRLVEMVLQQFPHLGSPAVTESA